MKHKLLVTLSIILTIFALNAVNAAAQQRQSFKIPFDFIVGNDRLPAGTYYLSAINPHVIVLGNGHKSVTSIVTAGYDEMRNQRTPLLVFKCVGRHHFLTQAWLDWNDGLNVPQGNIEKEVLRASRQMQKETIVAEK